MHIPGYDPIYLIVTGAAMLLSQLVGAQMKRKFEQYSQVPLHCTGAEIADQMLHDNDITDVQILHVQGMTSLRSIPCSFTTTWGREHPG